MNQTKRNRTRNKVIFSSLGILLVIVTGITSCNSDDRQVVAELTELVMEDEFDQDGAPNSELWSFEIGTGENGWGNNELQYYTDRRENVEVQNGTLLITAF